jgi:phospholipase/carboxylesterase
MSNELQTQEHTTGEQPTATVIVLHGLGASSNDFAPFVQEINLRAIGAVRWIFPDAPKQAVTINAGYVMPAWYDILGVDLQRREDEAGLRASQALVQALIDREVARGMPAHRIVLGGFSQGCAMTLQTGLRCKQRLAGLLGMSGYLPLAPTLAAERSDANALVPIFLAHGRFDEVITMSRASASRDALQSQGYAVDWREYPMAHSVCAEEVADIERWLNQCLQAA